MNIISRYIARLRMKVISRQHCKSVRFNNLATLMIHSDRITNIGLDQGASEFAFIEIESDILIGSIFIIIVHLAYKLYLYVRFYE